jgi:hypothetical protein
MSGNEERAPDVERLIDQRVTRAMKRRVCGSPAWYSDGASSTQQEWMKKSGASPVQR